MNLSPSVNPGSAGLYPVICPRCGASTLPGKACESCGAPLVGRAQPVSQPAPPLPLEYAGLQRPKVSSSISAAGIFMIIFGTFWTLFSLFFLVIAVSTAVKSQYTYDLLKRDGRVVQAMITNLVVDDSGDSTDYFVNYRYTATLNDAPQVFEQEQSISYDLYSSLRIGAAVPAVYAVSQPSVARLQADFHAPVLLGSLLMGGMGLLFVVIGLALLSSAIAGLYDFLRLKRNGQEINALVFDLWEDKDSEGDALYRVAYAFKAPMPDGTIRLLTRAETHRQAYLATQKGSIIRVRYLPDEPETCQIAHFR